MASYRSPSHKSIRPQPRLSPCVFARGPSRVRTHAHAPAPVFVVPRTICVSATMSPKIESKRTSRSIRMKPRTVPPVCGLLRGASPLAARRAFVVPHTSARDDATCTLSRARCRLGVWPPLPRFALHPRRGGVVFCVGINTPCPLRSRGGRGSRCRVVVAN